MKNTERRERIKDDLFSPWNEDSQMELMAINEAISQASKQQKKRHRSLRAKKISLDQNLASKQDEAMKNLLNIEQQDKSKKAQHLKDYLNQKKENGQKEEPELASRLSEFKLPPINKRKQSLNARQNSKKPAYEKMDQFVHKSIQLDNQEQHIFRKYGEHKNRQRGINVERSLSLGYQSIELPSQSCELQHKYETLDSSSVRNSRKSENMSELSMVGKKYSCQTRSNKIRVEPVNYMPRHSKITPHYILFGRNQEDVLKKVLLQLHHKFRQVK